MPNISAIIQQSFDEAEATCSWPWVYDYERPLPGTSLNVHHIFMIVVAVAAVINIAIALYLFIGHLRNWTRPHEQRQYARIILFPIWLSICTFLAIINYHHSDQIDSLLQLWEGVAIVAIYMLYIQIVAPVPQILGAMREIESQSERMKKVWKFVFQVIPVQIITFVAYQVVYGVTCPLSNTQKTANTVITTLASISLVYAIIAIIMFQRKHKNYYQGHSPMLKLVAFKFVIGLQAIQSMIFSYLAHTSVFQPSEPYHVSYNDLARGVPLILFAWELVPATVVFLWAFEFKRFHAELGRGGSRQSGAIGALIMVLNPMDILQGIHHAFVGTRETTEVDYSNYVAKQDGRA